MSTPIPTAELLGLLRADIEALVIQRAHMSDEERAQAFALGTALASLSWPLRPGWREIR